MGTQFRDDLRDQAALAFFEVAQDLGDQLNYSDRGETPVPLWCIPEGEDRSLSSIINISDDETLKRFSIPRQYDSNGVLLFPPANDPSSSAEIIYEGYTWFLRAYHRDSVGAIYTITTVRKQARRTTTNT